MPDRCEPVKIDAHQHFWRVAAQEQPWRTNHHGAIARDFTPADLVAEAARVGVQQTVLVQSVDEPAENERLAGYAQEPIVGGVVAWVPLSDPDRARAELDRLSRDLGLDKLSGVRCLIGKDPLLWLAEPAVRELMAELAERGLAWDVVPITDDQNAAVRDLARAVPDLRIVIDHLGRPPVEVHGWEPWAGHLAALAASPRVAVKLSVGLDVLTAWPSWRGDDLIRYVEEVCGRFGPDRVMLASNWPVVTLRASYAQAWTDLERVAERLFSGSDLARVIGGTAAQWYGLHRSLSLSKGQSPSTGSSSSGRT